MIFDDFYKLFEIQKIEVREPGRTVDDDGEICEWYISEEYPPIEPVFFDLLNIYDVQYNGPAFVVNVTENNIKQYLLKGIIELYNSLNEELKIELKRDIQDTFMDYYGGHYD